MHGWNSERLKGMKLTTFRDGPENRHVHSRALSEESGHLRN